MGEGKKGFFARLKEGLAKTRNNIVRGIDNLFNGFSAIDDDFYEELEEILIMGDIGVNATTQIISRLKTQIKEQHIKEPQECKQLLIDGIKEQMRVGENAYEFEQRQSVIMVIGVNGVGKTTSGLPPRTLSGPPRETSWRSGPGGRTCPWWAAARGQTPPAWSLTQ